MTDEKDGASLSLVKRTLVAMEKLEAQVEAYERSRTEPIAVVGMSCRLPGGANDPEAFWRLLRNGVDAVTEVPPDRWSLAEFYDPDPETPGKMHTRWGAFLDEVKSFDAAFFGLAPNEATQVDPQHRLYLEVAWEALEAAGQSPDRLAGSRTGVFTGLMTNDYALLNLRTRGLAGIEAFTASGIEASFTAGRLSYLLGLRGPTMTVSTACSSSLVALHLAVRSLRSKECDRALAGGVNLILSPEWQITSAKIQALAADGRCKSFDAAADGYVRGEGCGVLVLRRLSDALADGDPILALVRGTAVNHDGPSSGLTVPSGPAQQEVIRQALADAGVEPRRIRYVEAHGSGTPLGDPIEMEALEAAYNPQRVPEERLIVGSVKSNVGHLEAAAGMAGVIKVILALRHGEIPPNLHFKRLNPHIREHPLRPLVPTAGVPWPVGESPRLAGVSSFGLSGTNAHVVLEEAPEVPASGPSRQWQLLALSARSPEALAELSSRLSTYLEEHSEVPLADVSYTLIRGRRVFEHRRAVACAEVGEAAAVLRGGEPARLLEGSPRRRQRPVVFLFPGLGEDLRGVGAELYREEQVFRRVLESCCGHLGGERGEAVRALLCGPSGAAESGGPEPGASGPGPVSLRKLVRGGSQSLPTELSQPGLFVYEYALARFWESWGIEPQALLGYSVGEYVAACLAGVLEEAEAVRLVADRGSWIGRQPRGGMVAVGLGAREVEEFLPEETWIGAWSGPSSCVVSGWEDALSVLGERLERAGVAWRRLAVEHAFHSPLLTPVGEAVRERIGALRLGAPRIPYLSNLTGDWVTAGQVAAPEYWVEQMCGPVRLSQALERVWEDGDRILLEVGPGQGLSSLALQHPGAAGAGDAVVVASHGRSWGEGGAGAPLVRRQLLEALGRLWVAGCELPGEALFRGESRRRVALPTYPFQRRRYWIDTGADSGPVAPAVRTAQEGRGRVGVASPGEDVFSVLPREALSPVGFYSPVWRQSWLPRPGAQAEPAPALIFADRLGLGEALAGAWRQQGGRGVTVTAGEAFGRRSPDAFTLDPGDPSHYRKLLQTLAAEGIRPRRIAHLWSVTGERSSGDPIALGFFSLLALAQALGSFDAGGSLQMLIVSDGMQEVLAGELLCPAKATLLGPVKVLPLEMPGLICRSVDLEPTAQVGPGLEAWARRLATEFTAAATGEVVAYRGEHRWVQDFDLLPEEGWEGPDPLRPRGVYLITGGLGGLGMAVAEALAGCCSARLVLVGRSLPSEPSGDVAQQRKLAGLRRLRELGAEVLTVAADVADPEQVAAAVERARQRFGGVHGVIHAAGVPGGGLAQLKAPEEARRVLAPKVEGARSLDAAFAPGELDFLVLFSSAVTLTGGIGEVDYCAANAFLDAFACHRTSRGAGFTQAIDWGPWRWDAWQPELTRQVPWLHRWFRQLREQYGFGNEEGAQSLLRALAGDLPRLAVLKQPLDEMMTTFRVEMPRKVRQAASPGESHPRPALMTPYVEPGDDLQAELARIWEGTLGIDRIGIHDNFFTLGGNSLSSMQVVARMNEDLGLELLPAILFEGPTVASLAEILRHRDSPRPSPAQVELAHSGDRGLLRRQRQQARREAGRRSR